MNETEETRLKAGAFEMGVTLQPAQVQALLRLLDELSRWSQTYNLTAIRAREEMLTHHLLDSLSIAPYLRGQRCIDVGTGAGFPGLPLAIAQPERQFVLLDSNGKKIRFVAHMVRTLGLQQVSAVHARAEDYRANGVDCVLARAFAPLSELISRVEALCGPETRVLAMKGRRSTESAAELPAGWSVEADHDLHVPGLQESRHLLVLRPPH